MNVRLVSCVKQDQEGQGSIPEQKKIESGLKYGHKYEYQLTK